MIPPGMVDFPGVWVAYESADTLLIHRHDDMEFWVPKSVIHDDSEVYCEDSSGSLIVPEWWVDKQGLIP